MQGGSTCRAAAAPGSCSGLWDVDVSPSGGPRNPLSALLQAWLLLPAAHLHRTALTLRHAGLLPPPPPGAPTPHVPHGGTQLTSHTPPPRHPRRPRPSRDGPHRGCWSLAVPFAPCY